MLELGEIASRSVVLPTLIAEEIQPGAPMLFLYPSFPAEMTVAMPTDRRLSIAAFDETFAASQAAWLKYCPPPRLILTAAISYTLRRA